MDPGAIVPIVMFAVFAGATPVIVLLGRRAGFKRNAGLRETAVRLGLEYSETPHVFRFMPPTPVVHGIIGGRRARIYGFSRGSGKSRTRWVAASVEILAPSALKFTMRTQGPAIFERIAGAFGYKDIVVGDPAFDSLLAVVGSDEAFLKAALIPEVRARIVEFWPKATGSRITVGETGEAVYEQQGSLTNARCRENLEKAFPVLGDMAALAEVHATTAG